MFRCFGSRRTRKCKRAVKRIKMRSAQKKRKKQANISFMKQVVASLLAVGREDEAFRRMDALLFEINHMACYDIIEKFCDIFLSQLPTLKQQQQSEFSPETREAMATLIFATARFPDLPELSHLRNAIMKRYRGPIDSITNAELVEKFQTKSFSIEKKLQAMKIIADEFSISWDPKEFRHEQLKTKSATYNAEPKEAVSNQVGNESSPTKDEKGCSHHPTNTRKLAHSVPENIKRYQVSNASSPYTIPPYVRATSKVSAHVLMNPETDEDEEEPAIDRLLMYYSKKGIAADVDTPEAYECKKGNGEATGGEEGSKDALERALLPPAGPISPAVMKTPSWTTLIQATRISPSGVQVSF